MRRRVIFSTFTRSTGILVGGTAAGQLVSFALLPLITRLYTPADFSVLAAYAALIAILAGIASLGFDFAIPMPENDVQAAALLVLALGSCAFSALVVLGAVLALPDVALESVGIASATNPEYGLILPAGVLAIGAYGSLQMWATRKKQFGLVAKTRLSQAAVAGITQVGFGLAHPIPLGLLLGLVLNHCAGIIALARRFLDSDRNLLAGLSPKRIRLVAREYSRFPKYVTLENLCNSASSQLPIVIIAALAAGADAGFLMLAMRAAQAPMGLIGGAVGQVYVSHAPEQMRAGKLAEYTIETLHRLVKLGVGPLLALSLIAPSMFGVVFGASWIRAGELVQWMVPWFILQFVAAPVSMVMHVVGRQRLMLILTVIGLVLRVGSLIVFSRINPQFLSEAYAVSGAIYYLLCLLVFCYVAGVSLGQFPKMLKGSAIIMMGWMGIGIVLLQIFKYVPGMPE